MFSTRLKMESKPTRFQEDGIRDGMDDGCGEAQAACSFTLSSWMLSVKCAFCLLLKFASLILQQNLKNRVFVAEVYSSSEIKTREKWKITLCQYRWWYRKQFLLWNAFSFRKLLDLCHVQSSMYHRSVISRYISKILNLPCQLQTIECPECLFWGRS